MVNFTILAGVQGISTVISTFSFMPGPGIGCNGTLSLISQANAGTSPSWIQQSPHNSSILYANNEVVDGQLVSFTIGEQGEVNLIANTTSGGNGPAYLLALKQSKEVAILNYGGGNGLVVPLQDDLLNFVTQPPPPLITFNPAPAPISHPHEAVEVGDQLFVPDLGADKVWRLNKTSAGTWNITGFITQPTGSGPRHMIVQDGIMYLLHELASLLTSQKIPSNDETSSPFISMSLITPAGVNTSDYGAAEIQMPRTTPEFPERLIYTSNRQIAGTEDPRGDSIAIFSLASNGSFSLVRQVHTGLQQLRGFIVDPSGRYLVAGGNVAGGVKVFERIHGGTDLVQVAASEEVPTASTFVWL
ncbi:Lactonase, 7-bladed beta-propeller-domain-containing protein [Gautieria morchelliformis]|nr:Lactonase, 7-bladed beta-propeller-domain-containing protein [Gautieria morchelliformis]